MSMEHTRKTEHTPAEANIAYAENAVQQAAVRGKSAGNGRASKVRLSYDAASVRAVTAVEKLLQGEKGLENSAFGTLAAIYALHKVGLRHPDQHRAFLLQKHVDPDRRRKGTSDEYLAVKACFPRKEWDAKDGRMSQYARAIQLLGRRKIPIAGVSIWLRKEEDIDGSGTLLSGFDKVRAIWAKEAGRPSPREKRLEKRQELAEKKTPLFIIARPQGLREIKEYSFMLVRAAGKELAFLAVEDRPEIIQKLPLSMWK